ncbi:MAG: hypothetical protein AB7V77_04450 [Candidatus Woesearchaeota archaeon]
MNYFKLAFGIGLLSLGIYGFNHYVKNKGNFIYENNYLSSKHEEVYVSYVEGKFHSLFNNCNQMVIMKGDTTFVLNDTKKETNLDWKENRNMVFKDYLEEIEIIIDGDSKIFYSNYDVWKSGNVVDADNVDGRLAKQAFSKLNKFYNDNRLRNKMKLINNYLSENSKFISCIDDCIK